MTVKVYSPVLPSVELFGAFEGIASATGANQTVSLTFTPTNGTLFLVPYGDTVTEVQLEEGSTATAYQKVVSEFDVTEAGVPSLPYISYNGVNTAYSTPALPAPLVDKAQVFAGVRKLLDVESIIINHVGAFSAVGGLELFAATSVYWDKALYGRSTEGPTGVAGVTIPDRAPVSYVEVGIVDYAQPAGSEFSLRTNGIAQAQNIGLTKENTGLLGTGAIYYGSRGGVSRFFNGRHYATLGPITRFSAANATTAQIEAAEAYYTARVI